jgi:hypothetical protein
MMSTALLNWTRPTTNFRGRLPSHENRIYADCAGRLLAQLAERESSAAMSLSAGPRVFSSRSPSSVGATGAVSCGRVATVSPHRAVSATPAPAVRPGVARSFWRRPPRRRRNCLEGFASVRRKSRRCPANRIGGGEARRLSRRSNFKLTHYRFFMCS